MTLKDRLKKLFGMGYKPITKIATQFDDDVVKRYIDAGAIFGDAVSYIYMGECVGFAKRLENWENAELAYSALGYRTLSLDQFVDYGGYGKELIGLTVPRDEGEEIVLHAKYYRDNFFNKVEPVIDFNKMMEDGEAQFGNYAVPSTKHLNEK